MVVRGRWLEKNRVIVINLDDDPPLGRRIRASDVGSSNLAFSPNGRFLASEWRVWRVLEWEVDGGELNGMPLSGHDRPVSSLAYAPDGKVLVSGSEDGTVIFWDMDKREPLGPQSRLIGLQSGDGLQPRWQDGSFRERTPNWFSGTLRLVGNVAPRLAPRRTVFGGWHSALTDNSWRRPETTVWSRFGRLAIKRNRSRLLGPRPATTTSG
jgi:hypothetical protein